MAKTKDKKKGLQIRRVKTKKERGGGQLFKRLKDQERMVGYALFTPDPEAENNPGWFEYLEHYDNANKSYVACIGDDCYMCDLGDSPSTRALSIWYFPDEPEKERIKVFKMNGYLIRDFTEIEEEEGGVFGRKFRVKRTSERGEYRATPTADKPLTKKEVKALLSEIPDLEELMVRQTQAAIKKADAVAAMTEEDDDDEDEDDEEDEQPKSRRGKPKAEEPDEDDDDDDDDEDDEDEDDDDDENDDDSDDDEDEDDDESDDEDDDDDDDDDDEEESESESLSGEKFTVVSTSESDETITVKIEGKNAKLWIGEGVEADWDVVKKGAEITVDAEQDAEGDWVITSLKAKKAGKPKGGKGSKGGKKK